MFNYENYLYDKLSQINVNNDLNLKINIAFEESFIKPTYYDENSIYVILRYMSADLMFANFKTQPIQIMVMTEENSLERTTTLLNIFAETYNQEASFKDSSWVKQLYTSPVVVSNFEEVGIGFRSLVYVSATLLIADDVLELNELEIDDLPFEALDFGLQYAMQPNTQPVNSNLCESVKNTATLSLSFSLPLVSNQVITKILNICKGATSGNSNFKISFKLGTETFGAMNYKLTSAIINTSKTQLPSIQIGVIL